MGAPANPVYGATFRTDPDDGVRVKYEPYGAGDSVPWEATYPDDHPARPVGGREWLADDELADLYDHLVPADD